MGRASREKGKRLERQAAAWFREQGYEARRGAQHSGSKDSPDVKVKDIPNLHLEVKGGKKLPDLYTAIAQARADAGDEQLPVVMMRKDRSEWLFVVDGNTFAGMLHLIDLIERLP